MKKRPRTTDIEQFALEAAVTSPNDVVRLVAAYFKISRQAAHRHISNLVHTGVLTIGGGNTNTKTYSPAVLEHFEAVVTLAESAAEHEVWMSMLESRFSSYSKEQQGIWFYGFTEMYNNALEHSTGTNISVTFRRTAHSTQVDISDDGVGIFRKVRQALNLLSDKDAHVELSKGKFSTEPENHSGEGIFFTSRMFDRFTLHADDLVLQCLAGQPPIWSTAVEPISNGTKVSMMLKSNTKRTAKEVFDQFAQPEEYAFSKTVIPVKLAETGTMGLVSRSQARRILERMDRFLHVVLDFTGVEEIGQAFADEIFRVFVHNHREIRVEAIACTPDVQRMISRAQHHR